MANKYVFHPIPPKEEIESLYFGKNMTQTELAQAFGVSQKMVFGWFRKLGIQARVAAKRDQGGEKNHQWKGSGCGYSALHFRVERIRGKPQKCEDCGTADPSRTYDWANISGKYLGVDDFKRLCRSCHWKMDKKANNFTKNLRSAIASPE
jgi:hypothetical protein